MQEHDEELARCIKLQVSDESGTSTEMPDTTGLSGAVLYIDSGQIKATADATLNSVTTVAGISSDVSTVAGIAANVTTVAGIDADVTTVAGMSSDVNNYADTYQGAKATAPTTRNDASALQAGDMYFNTTDDYMYVYTGSAWQRTTDQSAAVYVDTFTGDNSTAIYTLSAAPADENAVIVFLDGVRQAVADYGVSGTTLTFAVAPGTGVEIELLTIAVTGAGSGGGGVLDIVGLPELTTPDTANDYIAIYDASAVGNRKISFDNLLANNSLALSKFANITADRLLGSDGIGDVVEITAGSNITISRS